LSSAEEAGRLLRRAESDAKAFTAMRGQPEFDGEIVGFHAQQAVETRSTDSE
jgi:hypothetical protein